jgi:hypothetical protein
MQQPIPTAAPPSPTKGLDQSDPWELYIYAIKAPATKAKYCQRLRAYLEFLGYPQDSVEDKARAFAAKAKTDSHHAFNSLLRFFQMQRERIERKEIAIGTVRNYAKAIKLFYEMADINVAWKKIMLVLGSCRTKLPTIHYRTDDNNHNNPLITVCNQTEMES